MLMMLKDWNLMIKEEVVMVDVIIVYCCLKVFVECILWDFMESENF